MNSTAESLKNMVVEVNDLLGGHFRVRAHDRFRAGTTDWYLLPKGYDWPAYRFPKLYFSADNEKILGAFYIEKGLELSPQERGLAADDKLLMTDDWAWRRYSSALASGELTKALTDGATRSGLSATIVVGCGHPGVLQELQPLAGYRQFEVLDDNRLTPREGGSASECLPREPEDMNALLSALESHPNRKWLWVDILMGGVVEASQATADAFSRHLSQLAAYV